MKPTSIFRICSGMLQALVLATVATTQAETITWDGSNDQFWGKGNNWQGPVPTAADDVVFDDTAFGYTVNLGSESRAANSLTIGSASAYTLRNQSGTPLLTLTVGDVTVLSGMGHVFDVPIVLSSDATYAIATGADLTINGSISGTDALTKTGDGDLTLSGANTHTGTTTISAGRIVLGNALALQNSTVEIGLDDALDLNGHDATLGGLAGDGALALGANTLTVGGNDSSTNYDGVLSGTGGLIKDGTGTLSLTGDHTYTGDTTISAGGLQLGNGGTTGSILGDVSNDGTLLFNRSDDLDFSGAISGSGNVTQAGAGTLTFTADHTYTGGTMISAGDLQLGNGGTTGSILGDVSNDGTLLFNRSDDLSFSGVISGSGAVTKLGTGDLTLTSVNTHTGITTISDGRIILGNALALQNSTVAIGLDDALDLNGHDALLGGLAGGGALALGANSLTVGGNNASTNYGGVLSGTGGLIKDGTGTLSLTGAHTYTGGTTISAGRLQLGNGGTTGSILGDVSNAGTLLFNRSDDATFSGMISGSGAVTQTGAGTTILTSDHTYTGGTTINAGSLQLGNGGTTGWIMGNVNNEAALIFNRSDDISFSGVISGSGSVTKLGAGDLTLTSANTHSGTTTLSDGRIILGNALALQNSTVVIGLDDAFDLNGHDALLGGLAGDGALALGANTLTVGGNNASTNYGGVLSGTGGLIKDGTGTLSLTGAHTYTGGTTISAGGLQFGNGGTTGWILGDVSNNGTLLFNRSDDITFNGAISGSGAVTKLGAGDLTLTSANTHTGTTTISDGRIILGNALALQNSTVEIGLDDAFDLNGHDATLGGLAGDGALALGANTLTVGGNNASTNYDGVLSGTGSLIKQGAGALALSGDNPFTGDTIINQGGIFFAPDADGFNFSLQHSTVILNVNKGLQHSNLDQIHIGSLAGSGNFNTSLSHFAVGGNNASTTFSGNLTGVSSSVDKVGTGTWTLAGSDLDLDVFYVTGGAVIFQGVTGTVDELTSYNQPITFQNGASLYIEDLIGNSITIDRSALVITSSITSSLGGPSLIAISDPDGGTALTFNSSLNMEVDAIITDHTSGPGSIETLGSGALFTLTSDNTYTGGTTIGGGTLQLGNGGTTGSILGNVINNRTLIFNRSDNLAFSGVISGSGAVTKLGAGDLTLNGANTYSGITTISDGRIVLGNALALKNSTVAIGLDDALDLNGHDATLGGLAGGGALALGVNTLTVGGNNASTSYDGVLSGTGGLIKNGTGILSLSGDNPFGGDTVINAGAIHLVPDADDVNTSLQNSTVTLNVDNGLQNGEIGVYLGALAGSGDYDTNGAYVEVGANNASTTYSGNFTHESLGLRKEGTGTWTLAGNDLRIQEFLVGDGAVIFDGAGGTVVALRSAYQPVTFQNGADVNVVNLGGSDITIDRSSVTVRLISPFTLDDIIAISDPDGSTALTFNSDADRVVASTIIDHTSGPGSIEKLGAGTLTLSGANTYTGETTINAGTLIINGSIASGSLTTVNDGGTLGGNGTVGDLLIADGGTISPGASPGTLTAGDTTWMGGGYYEFEINNATGAAGTNWDLLDIAGTLDLASLSAANPFTITVFSLDGSNAFGNAENFDPTQNYSWVLVTSSGGIGGFSSDQFAIDSSGFQNAPGTDRFSLSSDGSQLTLSYAAVPEPHYGIAMVLFLAALAMTRRGRRSR